MFAGGLFDIDASALATWEETEPFPLPESIERFFPGGWSPSGRFLAGTEAGEMLKPLSIGAFEPATGTYHPSDIPLAREEFSGFAGWLDDRRYLVRGAENLAVVDVRTGAWRSLAKIDGNRSRYWLNGDRRTLLGEVDSVDGDIWLLERTDDTVSTTP